jgi:hypothetical protein
VVRQRQREIPAETSIIRNPPNRPAAMNYLPLPVVKAAAMSPSSSELTEKD